MINTPLSQVLRSPREPKHRLPDVVDSKKRRRLDSHVAPLNKLVEEINENRGDDDSAPWFDADGGGIRATVLFLLENPGPRSTAHRGSGFISADNNDGTAANFFRLCEEAGLAREAAGRLECRSLVSTRWGGNRERNPAGRA